MRRIFLVTVLAIGTAVLAAQAQQEPSSPPPMPPPPADQAKPRPRPAMTNEQRAELEQRLDAAWGKMSVEGKTRLMRLHRALSEMPPDERKFIHDRVERFLNMSPAEREKLKQNRQQWEQMSPEQRQNAREEFRKRRDYCLKRLDGIKRLSYARPQGAFYVFFSIAKTKLTSSDFAARLLDEKYVSLIPGAAFGMDDYVRISFATSMAQLEKGMDRLEQFVNSL